MSEEATQVLVPGSEGDFTVLADHAPVVAMLRPGLLDVLLSEGGELRFFVRGGFAEVELERLTVLAQQAINTADLDRVELAQQITDAEEDAADAKDEAARHKAQDMLDRLKVIQQSLALG